MQRNCQDLWAAAGALSEVLAKRQGRVCWTCRNHLAAMHTGGGEELSRQSMLGPELAGDSSWWQAPPFLGGECLPFVSWLVNSLSPCLPSSICSQPSILPLAGCGDRHRRWGVWGLCLLPPMLREGGVYCIRHAARIPLKRSCSAGDILCPWGPVSKSL